MKKNRRTNFFVRRSFQMKYIVYVLLVTGLVSLIAAYTSYITTYAVLTEKLEQVYPQGELLEILKSVNTTLILRLSMLLPVIIVVALFLSHKIAGPLVRINDSLSMMASGNFSFFVKLRKKDDLQDVAQKINEIINATRYLIGRERAFSKHYQQLLSRMEKMAPEDDARYEAWLYDYERVLTEMRAHLMGYKIGDARAAKTGGEKA